MALECDGATTWLDPSVGPGQVEPVPPSVYQLATYRGEEAFESFDKRYWNTAIGLNLGANAKSCTLKAYATASQAAFATDGATPADTVSPYIAFDLALTDGEGAYTCSSHPLNVCWLSVNMKFGWSDLGRGRHGSRSQDRAPSIGSAHSKPMSRRAGCGNAARPDPWGPRVASREATRLGSTER